MGNNVATLSETSAQAVFRINLALQGPVVDILGQFLPELNALARDQAYDRVLDDIGLLSRCFGVFHRERARFRSLLIDERRRPVVDDSVPLSCGRTLAEVIAMIVRTAAKRYFRRTLGPRRAANGPPARSAADDLYDAIKAYLLHDWQVPLVPDYARMDPAVVRRIGDRLLDAREPASLARLIANPDAAVAPADERTDRSGTVSTSPPLPVDLPGRRHPMTAILSEILDDQNLRLRPEAFTHALLDPEVRAALPNVDDIRVIGEILGGVGAPPAVTLIEGLGLRKDQLAVMLVVAQDCIGTTVFARLFGPRADPELVLRIVSRARLHGIGPESGVIDCAIFMRGVFARFGHRSRHDH